MKKLFFTALACVAFAGSSLASSEIIEFKTTNDEARICCDLKFVTIGSDGSIIFETKRGCGFNLDCEKEQAKVDKINDKRIANSKADFRNIQE